MRRVNIEAPSAKVIVIASPARWEAAYREHRIFYYAVEPFADNEIVDILDAAFRCFQPDRLFVRPIECRALRFDPISGVRITNRNGHKVELLASPGLLRRDEGVGRKTLQNLIEQAFPVVTTPGDKDVTPANVLKTAASCTRVMILLAKDIGRLPGSLVRDTKADYVSGSRESASKVTTLIVQPRPDDPALTKLDDRTITWLARHIVQEMASY